MVIAFLKEEKKNNTILATLQRCSLVNGDYPYIKRFQECNQEGCDPGFSDSQPVPIPGNTPSSSHVSLNMVGKHWRVLTSSGSLYESPETDRPTFYGHIKIICAWGLAKWFGS